MAALKLALDHILNPLHVYCRLRDFGVRTPTARVISRAYERWLYRTLRP